MTAPRNPQSSESLANDTLIRCINVALAEVGVYVGRRDVESKHEPTSLRDVLVDLMSWADSDGPGPGPESHQLHAVGQALAFSLTLLVDAVERLIELQQTGSYTDEPQAAGFWHRFSGGLGILPADVWGPTDVAEPAGGIPF